MPDDRPRPDPVAQEPEQSAPPKYNPAHFDEHRTTLPHGVAYGKLDGLTTSAILERNGETIVMQSLEADPDYDFWRYGMTDFRESPSGRYVLFDATGWEWRDMYMYDTVTNGIVVTMSTPETATLTKDERRLVTCSSAGMSSDSVGKVLSLPEGKILVAIDSQTVGVGTGSYIDTVGCSLLGNTATFDAREIHIADRTLSDEIHRFDVDVETGKVTRR